MALPIAIDKALNSLAQVRAQTNAVTDLSLVSTRYLISLQNLYYGLHLQRYDGLGILLCCFIAFLRNMARMHEAGEVITDGKKNKKPEQDEHLQVTQ